MIFLHFRALGQGAFGEVYEGVLNNVPGEPLTLSIAVKTLPDIATPQSQSDFEMEALIMRYKMKFCFLFCKVQIVEYLQ